MIRIKIFFLIECTSDTSSLFAFLLFIGTVIIYDLSFFVVSLKFYLFIFGHLMIIRGI